MQALLGLRKRVGITDAAQQDQFSGERPDAEKLLEVLERFVSSEGAQAITAEAPVDRRSTERPQVFDFSGCHARHGLQFCEPVWGWERVHRAVADGDMDTVVLGDAGAHRRLAHGSP